MKVFPTPEGRDLTALPGGEIGGVQFHSAARHVHAVAVPAGAHGRIGVVMSLGVIFARFKEECHLLVGDLEEFASLLEGLIGATVAVKGIVSLALASRVVEEGEEGNNGRISASSPAQIETEPLHALPVIGAVDGGKNQFGLGGDMGPRFATAGRSRDHPHGQPELAGLKGMIYLDCRKLRCSRSCWLRLSRSGSCWTLSGRLGVSWIHCSAADASAPHQRESTPRYISVRRSSF